MCRMRCLRRLFEGTAFANEGRGILITTEYWEDVGGGDEREAEEGLTDLGDEDGVKGMEVEGEEDGGHGG